MEGTDSVIPTESLSTLPPEILNDIFDEANTILFKGICRTLLPFTRRISYKVITITSVQSFKLFCQTIGENRSIGAEVLTLNVMIGDRYCVHTEELDFDQVVLTLRRLINLQNLDIQWCYLASIISNSFVAMTSLPQLKELKLHSPFLHRSDPWNPSHFEFLKSYFKLQHLTLATSTPVSTFKGPDARIREMEYLNYCNDTLEEDFKYLKADYEEDELLAGILLQYAKNAQEFQLENGDKSSVTNLTILGRIVDKQLIELVNHFESIKILDIKNSITTDNIFRSIKESTAVQITSLILQSSERFNHATPVHIYPRISLFTGLTHLTLPHQGFTSELFLYLRNPLPLIYLKIANETPVTIKELKSLILPGIAKLSTLKILELDIVEGKFSPERVSILGPCFNSNSDDEIPTIYEGWKFPNWIQNEFDEKGLIELIKLGNENGIKIIGSSVSAIGVDEAFNLDEQLVLDYINDLPNQPRRKEKSTLIFGGGELDNMQVVKYKK